MSDSIQSSSIQLTPAVVNAAQSSKSSALEGVDGQGLKGEASEFNAMLTNYVESEPVTNTQKMNQSVSDLFNQDLPQDLLTTGNNLPQQDTALAWQSAIAMQPGQNVLPNSVELQKNYLLDQQRNPVQQTGLQNNSLLNQQYLTSVENNEAGNSLGATPASNNISSQLAAVHFTPERNEVSLVAANDQLVPIQGPNTGISQGAAAVGLGSAVQAANTQTQMMPLNLGQGAWEANLGTRLQMMVGQNVQVAEIRLDPPELGALDIKIKVSNDVATINITSPHTQVRDALETAIPRLREMFEESGLSLGDVNVRQESFSDQQGFENEDENQFATTSDTDFLDDDPIELTQVIKGDGLLDIYA